ncbi:MAG: D-alanyl-D-alanine carboxypeptidase family protein, partial [Eggerthella lenta]
MNARRRHLRAAACLTLVGLLACLPLAAAFGSVNEDDMVLRLSAAERALPPDRLPDFDASCAALMDEDGTLWFGRNADDAAQIASLTKIMTAIVAADWLDASTMIEVTPEAASVGESSAGLAQGDSMTFDDALKALLTASGNDAASAIAQAAGARMLAQEGSGGDAYACEAAFVEAMNAKAAELGLE